MALGEFDAGQFAQKLILAMAESGAIKISGGTTTKEVETVKRVANRDAEYLTTLYRDLVSGLQK